MKKQGGPAMLAAAMLAVAGCNTSEITMQPPVPGQTAPSGAKVAANLEAENWGIFLFYGIPLWSGNPGRPNRRDYVVFGNRVKEKYMDMMLRKWAKEMKADGIEELKTRESSTGFFSLWILWRREISATAVAVEKK